MKLLIAGDLHMKISSFLKSVKALQWIEKIAIENKVDMVINLGDSFDNHAIIRAEILNEFTDHVERLTPYCKYIFLLGNHECYRPNDSKYHVLRSLKNKISNFIVVDQYKEIDNMSFVPFLPNVKDFPNSVKDICFAHQTFIGASYSNLVSEQGVDPNDVSAEIIISGHVHTRQVLGKVHYIGSLLADGLDDIDQEKGVIIFDTDTYEQVFIKSPFPGWYSLSLKIDSDFTVKKANEALLQLTNNIDTWNVDITGPRVELNAYLNSKDFIKLRQERNIRPRIYFVDSLSQSVRIKAININDILFEYIEKVYNGSILKDILKEKLINILGSNTEG